jgi:hypothetical protein
MEWAVDFACADVAPASDPDLADLADFAVVTPVGDPELADLFELETAVSSRQPLDALSKSASFRAGDWQSVIDVLFRFTSAKPSRWRETSHALKEILRLFPESAKCLEGQGKVSVDEQLLWLSIDDFDGASVAGSLDPTRPNFGLAWREFHSRGRSPLMAALLSDDVEGLELHRLSSDEPGFKQVLRVVSAGGDIFESATGEHRELSIVAAAAQCGAVNCVRFLLRNGTKVGPTEIEAAFRGGRAELVRLLWDAFPRANPLKLALEAVKSWNATGLRWLLDHKVDTQSHRDLIRLLKEARAPGSYSCASSVLGSSVFIASRLRLLRPLGGAASVLYGRLPLSKTDMEFPFFTGDSMAADYAEELRELLPDVTEVMLVAKHEGRNAASVNAFIDAAK